MSKRNSQAAKSAARERLRIEREKQAKRDKMRRQLIVAGSVVGVLAIAGGVGFAVVKANEPGPWEKAADQKLVKPANTAGARGTTVVIGKDDAPKTLKIYEDPRCPVCASFEQNIGETIDQDLKDGKYKLQFVGASFLDRGLGGEGSKNALSALGAALNVSDEAFMAYKAALFSVENHPEESKDEFAKDSRLLEIANQVPELKGNSAFKKDVEDGTYDKWALEMSKVFDDNKDDVKGTPSLVMDGKKITAEGSDNAPQTPEQFNAAVDKALKG